MCRYIAEIKEVGNQTILTPSLICDRMTVEGLVRFWGLNESDVEWYRLYQIVDGKKVELHT